MKDARPHDPNHVLMVSPQRLQVRPTLAGQLRKKLVKLPTCAFLAYFLGCGGSLAAAKPTYYQPPAAGASLRLDDGTPLIITPVEDISSTKNHIGDPARFRVIHRCRVNGVVLVEVGALVQGLVEKARHSKMLGRAGTLEVSFQTTRAVDGSILRLRATLSNRGNQKEDDFVHVVKFLPLPYGTGLLFNGRDAILKAGVPLTVFVDQDADFTLRGGTGGPQPQRVATLKAPPVPARKAPARKVPEHPNLAPPSGGTATPEPNPTP